MELGFTYFFNCVLMGVGLAMDAFSVSLANGLNEPRMKRGRMCLIAGIFAVFQALMPILGWVCVHTVLQYFQWFEKLIPWIALVLLGWIGGKMLYEGIKCNISDVCNLERASLAAILVQGIATSIDAFSVGFTIAEYELGAALLEAAIIAAVTFVICFGGIVIGKHAGTKLAGKAGILGGAILIIIGLEIFVTGII